MNDVTIIGSGPAGLTAAIYIARASHNVTVYGGLQHGGQLTTTTEVENFPGFAEGIMGPKLMEEMTKQAQRFGTKIEHGVISKVDFSGKTHKLWSGDSLIESKSVIIATGATARTLNLENEKTLMGRGISTCATCDGFFYKNKTVVVVGGGDSAMEEAHYLSKLAKTVILVHRKNEFRASKIMADRVKKTSNIELMTPWQVISTPADKMGLTGVEIENTQTKEKKVLDVDGLFYAIGHTPNSQVFAEHLQCDDHGYIVATEQVKTVIPGVFVAGDIADKVFRQGITAAGLGCQAGMLANKYLEELNN